MTLTLSPVPPYDFLLSTFVFSHGDPEIRKSEGKRFWQVIRVNRKLVFAEVTFSGDVEASSLAFRYSSKTHLSTGEQSEAGRIISRILNLEEDLTPFYQAVVHDLPMYALVQRLRGLKAPTTPTLFEALVDSIIEQQISLNVARVLESRLVKMFGEPLVIKEQTFYAFPTPEKLVTGTVEQFRACGLSARKGEYIQNAAGKFAEGEIDPKKFEKYQDSESIVEELCELRGIGKWTAELAILRGLHRLDMVPADDLGIRRAISARYCDGKKITGEVARKIAKRWGEYKGIACFYLLIADQLGI
jgi:DNA-3-methyladenine glycosylase II